MSKTTYQLDQEIKNIRVQLKRTFREIIERLDEQKRMIEALADQIGKQEPKTRKKAKRRST